MSKQDMNEYYRLIRQRSKYEFNMAGHLFLYFFAITFAISNLAFFGLLFSAVLNTAFNHLAYFWLTLQAFNVIWSFVSVVFMYMKTEKEQKKTWKR